MHNICSHSELRPVIDATFVWGGFGRPPFDEDLSHQLQLLSRGLMLEGGNRLIRLLQRNTGIFVLQIDWNQDMELFRRFFLFSLMNCTEHLLKLERPGKLQKKSESCWTTSSIHSS
ncbi:unnamed protein product [Protopolystoma xenopodis]|uniref:Uncharacterized protein n=1 Tax=Protopolystoma xenopodis TaxID=117903 RepID=A0A3S5C314_9PLAT|nr:unnamed protein product [Protopolystoma xenopodis]